MLDKLLWSCCLLDDAAERLTVAKSVVLEKHEEMQFLCEINMTRSIFIISH